MSLMTLNKKFAEVPTLVLLKAVDQIKAMVDWLKSEDLHSEEFYTRMAARSIPIYVRWRLLKGNLPKFAEMSTREEAQQFSFAVLEYKLSTDTEFQIIGHPVSEYEVRRGWSWNTRMVIG